MKNVVAIIPALNPLASFIDFVNDLIKLNFHKIIIVNDGSDEKYNNIFHQIKKLDECVIVEHEKNFGKGRALKTGFLYVLKNLPNSKAVISIGAHGQHKIDDVTLILHNAKVFSDGIILGVRNFRSKEVPISTAIGNRAASLLFKLLFHKRLLDTQTGLRYIPKKELSWLVHVEGDSFIYDTNMLIEAIERKVPIYEIPLQHFEVKKNSIIYYDEILNMRKVIHQILNSFKKHNKRNF